MYEVQGTLTCPPTPPHPSSSVATCNVVNDPRDLSSMAIYHVRSTRNVNMPPHPTPLHPISSVATCNVVSDPRDLSSVAIFHVRSTRNVNMRPHLTPPHPISSVATYNVVNHAGDLSSVAIFHVRSTRNVNIPPPPHPTIAIFKNVRFTGTVFGPQAKTSTSDFAWVAICWNMW